MAPSKYLLDANVLIALVVTEHVHHEAAMRWYRRHRPALLLCPIVEGALMRLLVRRGHTAVDGQSVLRRFYDSDRHDFVTDSLSYREADLTGVLGHKQLTDTYLAELARDIEAKLVTFDSGLQQAHRDVAIAILT